jgi:hypothetical protein
VTDEKVSTHSGQRFSNPLYYIYQHGIQPQDEKILSSRIRQSLRRSSSDRINKMGDISKVELSEDSNIS